MPPKKTAMTKKPAKAKPTSAKSVAAKKPSTKAKSTPDKAAKKGKDKGAGGGKKAGAKSFDPQPVVHACIARATSKKNFGANVSLSVLDAGPNAVRLCINQAMPLKGSKALQQGEVGGGDTENTIADSVRLKLKQP